MLYIKKIDVLSFCLRECQSVCHHICTWFLHSPALAFANIIMCMLNWPCGNHSLLLDFTSGLASAHLEFEASRSSIYDSIGE